MHPSLLISFTSQRRFPVPPDMGRSGRRLAASIRRQCVCVCVCGTADVFSLFCVCVCVCREYNKGSSISEAPDEDEEILGSDDDEQEDPHDYTKGEFRI